MQTHDYDATLFYLHRMACPELMTIKTVTSDDILAKKIDDFVQAFMYESNFSKVEKTYESLLLYLDHVFVSCLNESLDLMIFR